MLPVYLAGSQQLLVLHGPRLTQRLWCIIEMYTFLKMGAKLDRLCILPLSTLQEDEHRPRVDSFDAREAQCSSESDRQLILGIIESGWGSVDKFNIVTRSLLTGAFI